MPSHACHSHPGRSPSENGERCGWRGTALVGTLAGRGTVSADRDISRRADGGDDAGFWSGRGRGPDRLAVVAYLRGAHAFLVDTTDGREVGVVDDVVIDDTTGAVVAIDVRGGWFGRRQ